LVYGFRGQVMGPLDAADDAGGTDAHGESSA
jgi:hypothetical protein